MEPTRGCKGTLRPRTRAPDGFWAEKVQLILAIRLLLLFCGLLYFLVKVFDVILKTNNKDGTFETIHPKLYSLIMFLLGVAIVVASIWLIKEMLVGLWHGVNYVTTSLSRIDAVVLVALITAGVSIFSVIMSSIVSKIIDYRHTRKNYLAQKREGPYGEFIAMVYKIKSINDDGSYTNEDMIKDVESFSKQLTLYGSKQVVEKWNEFRKNSVKPEDQNDSVSKDNLFILEDIMNQMRKDVGVKRVKKGNLLGFFINDIWDYIK